MKKISTLFAAMFAATSLFAAAGDILEIRPCDEFGYSKLTGGTTGSNKPYATLAAPLGSGEDLYFNVRLVAHDEIASASETSYGYYKLEHINKTASETNDLYSAPLSIGICIGENKRYAELVTIRRTPSEYTTSTAESVLPSKHLFDVIFHYRTQPGDQGLPIRLMLANGEPVPENYTSGGLESPTMEYAFANKDKWRIDYHSPDGLTVVPASFLFNPTPAVPTDDKPETDTLSSNASLEQCGFYVQTIKFADSEETLWEKPGSYWKSVGNNRTKTAEITFSAKIEKATTVYMWAVDSDWLAAAKEGAGTYDRAAIAVEMTGSDVSEQSITVGYEGTGKTKAKTEKVNMFVKKIEGGQSDPIQFKFKGLLADKNATLILSSSTNFLWKTGVGCSLKKDFVEIPVRSVKSEPELTLRDAKSKYVYDVTSDFSTPLTTLTLTLTDPYEAGDMTVTVTPKLTNTALMEKYTWDQLVRITKEEVSSGAVPAADTLTFTITAGDTLEKTLFLYGMGASADANHSDLKGNQIDFEITVEPEGARTFLADHIAFDTLYVNPEPPAIAVPSTEVLAVKETKTPIKITVTDNYTDVKDRTTGYTVKWQWWKNNVGSKVPTTREEQTLTTKDGKYDRFAPNTKGILYAIDDTGAFIGETDAYLPAIPSDAIPAGYENGYLWVIAPNKATSMPEEQTECLSVKVTVIELPKATGAYYTASTGDTETEDPFTEIETAKGKANTAYVGVTLEQEYLGGKLYVFLAPTEADMLKYISGNCLTNSAKSSDVYFDSTSTSKSKRGKLTLKDGIDGNTTIAFKMFLCKSAKFDETKVIDEYDCTIGDLEIENVDPIIHDVDMSGSGVDEDDPGRISGAATVNVDQIFKLTVWDADADKEATDNRFKIEYKFADGDGDAGTQGYGKKKTYYGNPDDFVVTNSFSNTGVGKFYVVLTDKDGGETEQEFVFDITDRPYVTLTVANEATGIDEKTHDASFSVALSQAASKKIDVYLTVTETSGSGGELILDGTKVANSNNTYKITFDKGKKDAQTLYVTRADGSEDGSTFSLVAAVATKDEIPDMEGVTFAEYYTPGKIGQFKVSNVNPTIKVDNKFTADGEDAVVTNTTPVAMGSAATIGIRASDVPADVTNITIYVTDQGDPRQRSFTITNSSTVVTTNLTFTSPGYQSVTVTAKDKDNGMTTLTIWYNVESAKMLNFWAVGPGVGAGNELTARYNTAGRGKGRIYVKNKTCSDATRWNFEFNCGLDSYVNAWAQGYCMGEVDDGTLNRRGGMTDIPINPNGGIVIGTAEPKYYTYNDDEGKDSFFYCWIQTTTGDNSEKTSALIGVPNPLVDTNDFAQTQVTLPTEADEKTGAYMPTTLEAVFAKEYLKTDNIGDINADGIPDIYALGYTGFGISAEEGTDTTDLSAFNDDGDYLPVGLDRIQTSYIFMTTNNWVNDRLKFDAKLEIRGYGDHLNNAWQVLSKQGYAGTIPEYKPVTDDRKTSYSEAEYDAWLQAGKPDDWSPERPSDPTKYDTDGDGLPDGYEYYIWYKAKVGWISNGTHYYLTGRKYNPLDLFNPTTIDNDTIAGIYDPIKRNNDILTTDTDNDGISDYAEFALGTNPFDFDTDGDGLPDGYEVAITGTDPCDADSDDNGTSDANENPDGDTMATYNLEGEVVGVLDGADLKYYCVDDGTFEVATDTEHPATGTVFTVEVKVDETTSEPRYYLTTKKLSIYADDEGVDRLATDYPSSATWLCSYDLEGRLVRGEPTAVSRGAKVVDSDEKTEFYNQTVTNVTKNTALSSGAVYNLWQYSNGAFARGTVATQEDAKDKPVVAHYAGNATIKVLHYQVYQARGYDPRTGWFHTDGSVDSAKYTNLDELLSMWFLYHTGVYTDGTLTPSANNPLVTIWKNRPTNPKSADSDGDKMPDGWELYLMNGDTSYSPMVNFYTISDAKRDNDLDGLEWPAEYSGLTSSKHYNWDPVNPLWRNKLAPTDPWNSDTDNDGLLDGEEGGVGNTDIAKHFFYNTAGIAGGGLNPLFMDTDHDGLPDPWEAEFHGTFTAGSTTTVTITEPDGTNTYEKTVTTGATWNYDGMDGTVADARLDYDGDGLANWQEYLVGAMRCWRYDDACSPWVSDSFSVTNLPAAGSAAWNQFWYDTLLDKDNVNGRYNPHLANGYFDLGRYFTCCKNAWAETSEEYGKFFYFKDGADHELSNLNLYYNGRTYNRNTYKAAVEWGEDAPYDIAIYQYPQKYISCDPREHDSDFDGMDDYYELFHGLNPLLGTSDYSSGSAGGLRNPCDLVFDAYVRTSHGTGVAVGGTKDAPPTALNNWWRNAMNSHRPATIKHAELDGYDFIAHPWLNGLPNADADGDGIVNIEESIMPNVQAASTYHHTDPSSLWTTDTSYTNSLVRRFYRMGIPTDVNPDGVENSWKWTKEDGAQTFEVEGVTYDLTTFPGFSYDDDAGLSYSYNLDQWGTSAGYGFSFEENEGYDSDHDYLSDYEEMKGKTKNPSDPQIHDDPLRRQAMYFNGKDAFLQTPIRTAEKTPLTVVSADPNSPIADEARQNFLYFTVECWAKADKESLANDNGTRTLVERAIYADNAGPSDEELIRKNFQIGIKNGRWYTCYDSTGTTKEKFEITDGPVATTNWTHIAATYDGTEFRLYVNGVMSGTPKNPTVQPEHGIQALAFTPYGTMTENGAGTYYHDQDYVTILVGASVKTKNGFVFDNAWRNRSYTLATATNPEGVNYDPAVETTFADYQNYYKGYIDEVRIWDGARTKADIQGDYDNRTRYTFELATENRLAVYNKWAAGGTRAPNSSEELPAQLMYHWAFDHVPGAVDSGDVIPVPAGFNTAKSVTDASARWVRPDDYTSRGWETVAVRSKIYDDAVWVPWINNTVAHLPRLDKTTLDSFYWSEDYAGYTPAVAYSNFNITAFSFPRNAEVASRWQQLTYDTSIYYDSHRDTEGANWADWWNGFTDKYTDVNAETQDTRWHAVVGYEAGGETWTAAYDDINLFRFTSRDRNTVGDDLLPMGGAYPRRISLAEGGMWDNQPGQSPSASDAWAQTGNDADNNGLPDWWEEYARANYCETLDPKTPLEWGTTVKYRNGVEMPAYQAYLRDLAAGLVKIGNKIVRDANYADTRDGDSDGLPDWWEEMYGLDTSVDNADDDPDNDGLSNYQEYMLGEYYLRKNEEGGFAEQLQAAGVDLTKINLNPNLACSTPGQVVPDYFLRYSDKFADITNSPSHFFANEYFGEIATDHDFMEDWWELLYDVTYTNSKKYDPSFDKDGDGWSTWAECRSSLWGGYFAANLIDQWTGSSSEQYVSCYPQPIIGVKATYYGNQDISGKQLVVRTTSGQTARTDATFVVPNGLDSQTRYLGSFAGDTSMHGHMSPGLLNGNAVVFERALTGSEKTYTWNYDWYNERQLAPAWGWVSGINSTWQHVSDGGEGTFEEYRSIYSKYPHTELEGADLTWEAFAETVVSADGTKADLYIGSTKFGEVDCTTGEYELDMSKFSGEKSVDQYVFRVTYTSRMGEKWPQTVYLSDTKELQTGNTAVGTGDGYVREGKNTIEAFIDLDASGTYTEGEPYGVVQNVDVGWHKVPVTVIELKDTSHVVPRFNVGEGASGETKTLKVRRVAINGQTNETTAAGVTVSVPKRTLATKTLVLDSRSYLTEADVLGNAKFDLDSRWLVRDAVDKLGMSRSEITDATYEIFEVQTLTDGTTSNVVLKTFVNTFNPQRTKPSAVSPVDAAPVYASSPTLAFSSSDETMTAYRLQIRRKGEKAKVYDSGITLLPGRVPNTAGVAVYEVTPPVYAGARVCSGAVTGEIFDDSTDYEWRVALFNAKFNEIEGDDDWSDWAKFQMDVANVNRYSKQATGYGSASVAVRYYGPTNMTENAGNIWVEAFENADFRGQPVARATLGTAKLIADYNDTTKTNALLRGLAPNTYYFRAFIDFNKNGQRDDWESWGYLNYVGKGMKAIYNPKPFVVTAATAEFIASADADFTIYIEDCDTNQNEYPDIPGLDPNLDTEGGSTATDSDGDGIADSEEETYGTDPALWDTDNDGMPDGYEALFADTDPTLSDAEECVAGDVMAFAKISATFITITNGDDAVVYMLAEGQAVPNVGDSAKGLEVRTTYTYPVWEDGVIVEYLGVGTNLTLTTEAKIQTVSEDGTAVLVHAQVYDRFGYDPTTATTAENAANTKEFTALDKFLVVRYLEAIGLANEATVNKRGLWEQYTLKPYDTDLDGDGIADGWELYVMFGPDGAGSETLADAKVSPWNYDDARAASPDSAGTANEIRLIDEYDGGSSPTDPWNVDTDGDGVSDYYASKYHLSGGNSGADNDGDGLSNYAEYLISEVFKFAALDPDNAKTDGSCVDYFRKYGDLYFGEIFTDHDQVSDVWEQKYAHHVGSSSDLYANRDIYDPSADRDDDGWSNYAEAQAGTSPENITAPGVDGEILKEYPVPAIRAKVVYRGHSVLSAPLVFQAWSEKTDPDMTSVPDAAWRAASDEAVTNVTKYIGLNPGTTRSYYLGTGSVSPGSVRIDFRDMAFERATVFNGEEVAGKTVAGEVGDSKWFYFVQDRDGVLYTSATNLTAATPVKVGTIDYATGYMTVDFGCEALQGVAYDFSINGDSSTSTDAKSTAVYSNCDKLNLSRSYVKIAWQPVKTDTTGNATYYLSDCTAAVANKGHVCEGKNKFVVFSDTDGDGAYAPGEPFGFVSGVEVGWQGGAFEVEIAETSPIFARVDLTDKSGASIDRTKFQAGNSTVIDVDDAEKLFKSATKLQIYGEATGYDSGSSDSTSGTSGSAVSQYTRVRVVRALVNGSDVLGQNAEGHNVYVDRAVVMDKYLDLDVRGYIHEGDFLSASSFDIGWSELQDNVYDRDDDVGYFIDATNITYMIVMGEGSVAVGESNTVFRSMISRTYDSVAVRQGGFVKPVIDAKQPGYVYGAKPTFRWAMQDKNGVSHNSYTAFKLQIRSGSTVVYDSGYRPAPARGADGWYEWALADPLGSDVASGNYTWRVAMFNAKFKNDTFWNNKYGKWAIYNGETSEVATWSENGEFVVDMNKQQEMNDHGGYSSIAAAVKYAGPSSVLTRGNVIVQAFETADFAGDPMGESFVTDDDEIVDTAHVVENVRVLGLPATGTYYLRAFIDSNCNGVKDDWESWGAADKPVTISTADVTCPTVGIYIEDADTDGDWIPDAYEYVTKGNLTALGPEVIDGDKIRFIGEISTSVGTAGISTGLTGASLTIFQNQSFVKLAMADLGTTVSIDDIRKAVEKKVNPDTVKITALTLAPDGSKVTLALSAEVTDSIAGELLGKVYDISNLTKQTVTVTVKVYKKNTLAEAGWTLVSTQSKTFGRDEQQIDVPVTGVNMTSGFYKVEVVQ